jgi:hydrogenase-4 component B
MQVVFIEWAFGFLLATLGLFVPIILIASLGGKTRRLAIALIVGSNVMGCIVAALCFWRETTVRLDFSAFSPFPLALGIDRLSAFPVAIFSIEYFDLHYAEKRRNWVWTFFSLFLASMILVVTASTGFAFLIGWELMTLLTAGLILMEGDSTERRHSVFLYLLMMHAGAAAVIGSFLLFLPFSHGLDFASLRSAGSVMPQGIRTMVFLLAFLGFGAKAGMIPLHIWLPRAHPIAPSPVSALMSGVMLKTAVYGFVRFVFDFLGGGPSWWSGYVVLAVGAVTGLLGILYAIAENDLKRLLAYSSVENIGIIFLGLGVSLVLLAHQAPLWAGLALVGALLHAFNHALFKSLLFLGAGAISDSTHTVNLEDLGGLQRRMPVTGLSLLVACCSIAGLPLFNGFVGEWIIFRSLLAGSVLSDTRAQIVLPLTVGILALIGGLAAACFVKVFGVAFLGRPRSAAAEDAQEAPPAMRVGLSLLAAACLGIGIFPGLFLRPLVSLVQTLVPGAGVPLETVSIARILPIAAAIVLGAAMAAGLLKRRERIARTWACGLPGLTTRMQYTSTVFSKPIRFVFSSVYKPNRKVDRLPPDQPYFPASVTYRSVRTTSYEKSIYRPFVELFLSAARGLRRMQTGNIQVYLLYIFLTLVLLLAFLRFQK